MGIILTIFLEKSGLDIKITTNFYTPESGFFLKNNPIILFLYNYSPIPAIVVAVISFIIYITSFFTSKLQLYKRQALFLMFVMIIGPGILINVIFKDHWGRPRPRQIQEFGGTLKYLKAWEPGKSKEGRSFPSGHASMGFYFMSLYYIFRNKNKKLALGFFVFGVCAGCIIGLGRIAQGAHFLSDVMWSGLFVYITCEALSPILDH